MLPATTARLCSGVAHPNLAAQVGKVQFLCMSCGAQPEEQLECAQVFHWLQLAQVALAAGL